MIDNQPVYGTNQLHKIEDFLKSIESNIYECNVFLTFTQNNLSSSVTITYSNESMLVVNCEWPDFENLMIIYSTYSSTFSNYVVSETQKHIVLIIRIVCS